MLASTLRSPRAQLPLFLALVVTFSAVFYALVITSHAHGGGPMLYVVGLMWCPALAAFATLRLTGGDLRELGWRWPAPRDALASWLIPLAYTAIAYAILWTTGLGGFPDHGTMDRLATQMGLGWSPTASTIAYVLVTGSMGMVGSLAVAVGEEIGWRGFLVPALFKRLGFTPTALVSAAVWAAWHVPIVIWGGYNRGTPAWFGVASLVTLAISMSFVLTWLRMRSGSLWTGALLHASHNLYIQQIFTPLTRDTGHTAWWSDEFGVILPLVITAFAVVAWRQARRGR